MVDKALKAILLLTPIAYYPGVYYFRFELIFFQVASMILFLACLLDKPKREFKLGKPIALYLGICLFTVIINGYNVRSLSALANIFFGCIDIMIISVYAKDLRNCAKWLVLGIGINTIVFIGQQLGYNPILEYHLDPGKVGIEHGGIAGNAPRFASLIALSIPFISIWYLIPLFILGFFLKEASIFVAIFVVLFCKIFNKAINYKMKEVWFKVFVLSLIFAALIGIGFFKANILRSINVRLMIWAGVGKEILLNPFKGQGIANFQYCDYAQSSFFQWIHGVGIVGVGFIVLCLKKMKWYLVPLLFLCLVEYPFEIPRLWFLIIFTIAYYAIDIKEEVELC